MRVRTYGFPGDLRGLPEPRLATTPTNRPRRSLSSPGMFLPGQCSAPVSGRDQRRSTLRHPGGSQRKTPRRTATAGWSPEGLTKRRGSGPPFEEPSSAGLAALRLGWRGLTPRWPRSLAARFRVWIQDTPAPRGMQELSITLSAFSGKNTEQVAETVPKHPSYPALSAPATMEVSWMRSRSCPRPTHRTAPPR